MKSFNCAFGGCLYCTESPDCTCECHLAKRDMFGNDLTRTDSFGTPVGQSRIDLERLVVKKAVEFQRRLGYRYVAELDLELAHAIDALRELDHA